VCHLVLLLPVAGIAVFWLWPLSIAVPVYGLILLVSGVVYYAMLVAMRHPVVTGREGLLHEIGEIVEASDSGLSVRVHGELWHATSPDGLKPRDLVEVMDIQGLTLSVRKTGVVH